MANQIYLSFPRSSVGTQFWTLQRPDLEQGHEPKPIFIVPTLQRGNAVLDAPASRTTQCSMHMTSRPSNGTGGRHRFPTRRVDKR